MTGAEGIGWGALGDAVAIVRVLAAADPFAHDGSPDSEYWCPMCGAVPDVGPDNGHEDRCPAALALAWVAEHPEGA